MEPSTKVLQRHLQAFLARTVGHPGALKSPPGCADRVEMTTTTPPGVFASRCDSEKTCQNEIVARFRKFLAGCACWVDGSPPLCEFEKHRMRTDKPLQVGKYAWAWSERTGKYVGCSFWSVAAFKAFQRCTHENRHWSLRRIEIYAQQRARGELQLQHEHVFPRRDWKRLVNPTIGNPRTLEEAWNLLDTYCQGCVVTLEEHRKLRSHGDPDNPWLRYWDTGIQLLENPAWSERHRRWIREAGLVSIGQMAVLAAEEPEGS